MNAALDYRTDSAGVAEIAAHLRDCDSSFIPPLSERVDIGAYASKLAALAVRFECWDRQELVGLVASYDNDTARPSAFITSVSTTASHRGRGIATRLLLECIDRARRRGARSVLLEASAAQRPALGLYEKMGFKPQGQPAPMLTLRLDLAEGST